MLLNTQDFPHIVNVLSVLFQKEVEEVEKVSFTLC